MMIHDLASVVLITFNRSGTVVIRERFASLTTYLDRTVHRNEVAQVNDGPFVIKDTDAIWRHISRQYL